MPARWHDAGAIAGTAGQDPFPNGIAGRFPGLSCAAGELPDTGGKCTPANHSPAGGSMMTAAMECPAHQGRTRSRADETPVEPIFETLRAGGARVEILPVVVRA